MTPTQRLIARIALRGVQLLCMLIVLVAMANIKPLMAAIVAMARGELALPAICWKILPVTAPLIPSLLVVGGIEFVLRRLRAPSHDPELPWMADPMWAAKHIRLNNRGQFWTVTVFFLAWLGIGVPLAIGTEKTPFMVFFGVFGLVLLAVARMFWLNRKWNTAELRMAAVPGVIGGPFSGVAILKQSFAAGTAFEVCLKCQMTTTRRSSGGDDAGSSSTTETLWSSTLHIDKPLPPDGPNRTLVPFSFAIPYDCEATREWESETSSSLTWNLVVNQKDALSSGGAVFPVPVFRTSDSSPNYELDETFIEPFQQEVDVPGLLQRFHMTRQLLANGGVRLTFSTWNTKMFCSIAGLVLVCFAGCLACFWFIPYVIGAIFASLIPGFLALAGSFALLDMAFWKSTIEFDDAELRCESGWQGFRKKVLMRLETEPTFSSVFDFRKENGEWFRVEVQTKGNGQSRLAASAERVTDDESGDDFDEDVSDGSDKALVESLVLVKRLDGRAEADAMCEWLRQQCLTSSRSAAKH